MTFLNGYFEDVPEVDKTATQAPAVAELAAAGAMANVQSPTEGAIQLPDGSIRSGDEAVLTPEMLQAIAAAMQPFISKQIADGVSIGLTTLVPDVIEKTLHAQRVNAQAVQHPEAPTQATQPTQPVQPAPAHQATSATVPAQPVSQASLARVLVQTYDPNSTFVPSYQTGRVYSTMDRVVGYLSLLGVVGAVLGAMVYTIQMTPQTQTVSQNQQLTDTVTDQNKQILESNQQVLDSKQRCGNFSLICNIKE